MWLHPDKKYLSVVLTRLFEKYFNLNSFIEKSVLASSYKIQQFLIKLFVFVHIINNFEIFIEEKNINYI